jgi:hypothetical protein
MSLRIDTTELISGAYVIGETGLGVLGSAVPSTGLYGASYLYNDINLPGEASDEFYGLILTPPSAGTFYAWEDSSFSLVGAPDGTYPFTYRGFKNGVTYGDITSYITIGDSAVISGTATLGDVSATGTLFTGASTATGTATLGNITASGSLISSGTDTFTGPSKARIGSSTLRAPTIRIGSPTL